MWLSSWNLDPAVLLLAGVGLIWSLRSHADTRAYKLAAVALFAALYISPLCSLGSALFTARVVHHLVLVVGMGPLMAAVLKLDRHVASISLPVATALQALVFWAWHAPPLYAAALSSDLVFWAMQLSLTGVAALWWARLRQSPSAASVAALLATMVQMGLLGALITFSGRALYAPHWLTTQAWGLSPLEDQQVAGLVMWAPASLVYLLAALTILYRSLGSSAVARS